jgi:DNA polymerase III delta prime subunit
MLKNSNKTKVKNYKKLNNKKEIKMNEKLNITEQNKQQFIDQLTSLINQINNISKIISKNSNKTESNNSNGPEEEWTKWQWTEFEIIWKDKKFKGHYWWNNKSQDEIVWVEEEPDFGKRKDEIINYIKDKIKQNLPIAKKREIWQLIP